MQLLISLKSPILLLLILTHSQPTNGLGGCFGIRNFAISQLFATKVEELKVLAHLKKKKAEDKAKVKVYGEEDADNHSAPSLHEVIHALWAQPFDVEVMLNDEKTGHHIHIVEREIPRTFFQEKIQKMFYPKIIEQIWLNHPNQGGIDITDESDQVEETEKLTMIYVKVDALGGKSIHSNN